MQQEHRDIVFDGQQGGIGAHTGAFGEQDGVDLAHGKQVRFAGLQADPELTVFYGEEGGEGV
jgi:hypothetical protein